jgi:hypothetical protein
MRARNVSVLYESPTIDSSSYESAMFHMASEVMNFQGTQTRPSVYFTIGSAHNPTVPYSSQRRQRICLGNFHERSNLKFRYFFFVFSDGFGGIEPTQEISRRPPSSQPVKPVDLNHSTNLIQVACEAFCAHTV